MPPIRARAGRARAACVLAAALAAIHAPAAAQDLERGRELYLDADFEGSRSAFESALGDPHLDRDGALFAHRHLATLNLLLGAPDAARAHARAAVALDPAAQTPPGSPREAEQLFDELRDASAGPATLSIETDDAPEPGAVMRIRVRLDPAPEALVAALHLSCESVDEVEERGRSPEVELAIVADTGVLCEAEALSRGGARLLHAERSFGDASRDAGGRADAGGAPAWPWLVAGAGVAVLAGVIALVALSPGSGDQAELGRPRVPGW
jgi:hypothetical protein